MGQRELLPPSTLHGHPKLRYCCLYNNSIILLHDGVFVYFLSCLLCFSFVDEVARSRDPEKYSLSIELVSSTASTILALKVQNH